jgi:hypothetical protein
MFEGKTIKSLEYSDQKNQVRLLNIRFTDGTHLNVVTNGPMGFFQKEEKFDRDNWIHPGNIGRE